MSPSLLDVRGLVKDFALDDRRGRQWLRAVDDVSFRLDVGETLGVVGESGCGKTTLGRLVLRLDEPTAGTIRFEAEDVTHLSQAELRRWRRHLQVVFQDPYSSLNPRMRVRDIIAEPLENFGYSKADATQRVTQIMRVVGLPIEYMDRHPHAFSGGQRQRIGIGRALALEPKLIVCDEAVSALDVSIQAQILNLFAEVQRELGVSLLFISHNLGVVRHVSHRILVMYLGQVVELAPEAALFDQPQHPYTQALISAVPEPDPNARSQRVVLAGDIPNPIEPPGGCVFHPRCPRAREQCFNEAPVLSSIDTTHQVRCHFPG